MRKTLFLLLFSLGVSNMYAQDKHPVVFAMPVLTIVPDAKAAGMGDIGVATQPGVNDQYWNVAKYILNDASSGLSASYIPWLHNIGSANINLMYLSGFYKIDRKQAIGVSLHYFSLGSMDFYDAGQQFIKKVNPNEFAIDASYSRLLGAYFSAGVAFRYLRSDITGGAFIDDDGIKIEPANAWGADIGFYYNRPTHIQSYTARIAAGLSISNIGSKVNYNADDPNRTPYFLPTILRLGGNLAFDMDSRNEFSFGLELSKYLIPTPPVRDNTTLEILEGKDDDVSGPMGMIQSFYDAPGGFSEELREIMIGVGVQYTYLRTLSVRGGYHHDAIWPNQKYVTVGLGIAYKIYGFDVSYMIPVASGLASPLANTLHISLSIDLSKIIKRKTSIERY
ncbi:MAG: type IX secretion system outer membrane channel protein PorV [Prevotellaceae bacterium]|nr:type IX secretion system outer membrane channel protein PorV [Prevotellaceae bacterium]